MLVPGINDAHIPEVAKVTAELGASILNIIPLIPQNEMKDIPAPTCADLEEVRPRQESIWKYSATASTAGQTALEYRVKARIYITNCIKTGKKGQLTRSATGKDK